MKEKLKNLVDILLCPRLFAVAYLPWLALNMCTVINILDFTRVVLILYAVWGLAVCVRTYLLSGKQPWLHKGQAILLFFLAACLLSQVLQFHNGGFDRLGKLCYFALCILVLYSQHKSTSVDYLRDLGILCRLLGIVIGALMLVSDIMFIEMYSGTINIREGTTVFLGFAENRLFGVFTSANVGGSYALILLWSSLVTLWQSKGMRHKVLWRVLAGVQILLGCMYISVSLSRGTYVSGAVMVLAFMLVRPPLAKEALLKTWQQWGIRIASAAVALLLSVGLISGFNQVSCQIMRWNYNNKFSTQTDISEEEKAQMQEILENAEMGFDGRVEANREDIDFTNKRASIWSGHLKMLTGKHLFIGVNHPLEHMNRQIADGATFDHETQVFVEYASGNLHNGYLQILVHHGLLAFLPMVAFLVLCAVKALRMMGNGLISRRIPTNSAAYTVFFLTLPMVLCILSNNVFESNFVLMGANFFQGVFWFAAGACIQSANEGRKMV